MLQHTVLEAIEEILPVPRNHKRDLPYAIRDLSRLLTQERGALAKAYWAAPRFLSAYLHYFLPWNLFRLSWLLPNLPLQLAPNSTVVDLGSGPLTLPLALWGYRPDLRNQPMTFLCTDTAQAPLEAGKKLFMHLAGKDSPWRIKLVREPMHVVLQKLKTPVQCIMAGNVLNELTPPKNTTLEKSVKNLVFRMEKALAPEGQLFLIEPGTRLGGKMTALGRMGALEAGMTPLLPCPHSNPCPMLPKHLENPGYQKYTGWCHFTYPTTGAPASLITLGKEAKLTKHNLAISFVLLQKNDSTLEHPQVSGKKQAAAREETLDDLEALFQEMMDGDEAPSASPEPVYTERFHHNEPTGAEPALDETFPVRIISAPIDLPGEANPARYACCPYGLVLVLNAASFFPGSLITANANLSPYNTKQKRAVHDTKSGALLVRAVR